MPNHLIAQVTVVSFTGLIVLSMKEVANQWDCNLLSVATKSTDVLWHQEKKGRDRQRDAHLIKAVLDSAWSSLEMTHL